MLNINISTLRLDPRPSARAMDGIEKESECVSVCVFPRGRKSGVMPTYLYYMGES